MNNIIKLTITLTALSLISCNKFLDRTPYDYLSVEGFYNTEEDLELAVMGCYSGLRDIKRSGEFILNEPRSDNATYAYTDNITSNTDAFFPSMLMTDPSNNYVDVYWRTLYSLIARTNLVLEHANVVPDEKKRNDLTAQARFLRAWAYFNLVRYFGPVPLITTPVKTGDETKIKDRDDVNIIYDFIIKDLRESAPLFDAAFSSGQDYGKAGKWAAESLLGKVLLTTGDKPAARTVLRDVYENSGYRLADRYGDLFVESLEGTIAPQEILFPIRFQGGGQGLGNNHSTQAASTFISNFGSNIIFYSNSLYDAFGETTDTLKDTRFKITCSEIPGQVVPGGLDILRRYPAKCVGLVPNGSGGYTTAVLPIANDGGLDWPELRFADVILMLAETEGFTEEGLRLLNEVRDRADAPPYLTEDINELFDGNFQEAVLNERRLELAFEGDRFFDLKRMGDEYASQKLYSFYESEPAFWINYPAVHNLKNQITAKGSIDAWRFLLPVPVNQILRSEVMKQNFGYTQ